jgi:Flp pilus assembly protein TadD
MDAVPTQRASVFRRIAGNRCVHIALIAIVGLLAYSNSFDAPFYFDDQAFTVNPRVMDIKNIPSYFFEITGPLGERPFTLATFALNYYVGSLDANGHYVSTNGHYVSTNGFHVVNVGLHLLNGALLYVLVLVTAGLIGMERREALLAAFFMSLVFVLHPLQTETVTYLVTRSMLIITALYFAGLIIFIRAARATGKGRLLYYVALFAVSLMGMASREDFVTFPVMLLLYDLFFISRFSLRGALSKWKLYVPAALPLAYLAFLVLSWDFYGQDAGFKVESTTPVEYLMTQFNVHWTYLRLVALPVNQNLDYNYPIARTLFELPTLLSFIGYAGLWVFALALSKKRPVVSFSMLWFLITITPASSFVPLVDRMFEHRMYLPSAGIFGVFTAGAFAVIGGIRGKSARVGLMLACILVLLSFGATSYARNGVWSDRIEMWKDAVKKSPRKARPHNNLGNAYSIKGFEEKAKEHFEKAIALDPFYADPHFNLASIYYERGMHEKAAEHFNYTVYAKPEFEEAHLNLALALAATGERKKAERHLKIAASLRPYPEAHFNLGVLYMKEGNREKARKEFGKALALNPGHVDARRFLEYVSGPDKGQPH